LRETHAQDTKITLAKTSCLFIFFQLSGTPHFMQLLDWNRLGFLRMFPLLHIRSALQMAGMVQPADRLPSYLIDSTKIDVEP
jgi:hypothetical protein